MIGSNGYLGQHLAHELKLKGFSNQNCDVHNEPASGIENYNHIDISKKGDLEQLDSGADFIFLFAGLTGTTDGFDRPEDFIRVNELGLLNLLTRMRENACKARVVFPLTRLVHKGRKKHTLIEYDRTETKTI